MDRFRRTGIDSDSNLTQLFSSHALYFIVSFILCARNAVEYYTEIQ
jgi:hypothetical protein